MYEKMTDDDFDRILSEIMNESPASHLLSIPGVYEAVSEHFNNDVLTQWEAEQETDDDCDDEGAPLSLSREARLATLKDGE